MGLLQHTVCQPGPSRGGRLRPRICLRKGCEAVYQPRRWNQRYCGDPGCRRELRRWQAARRQQRRRSRPEVRRQHADAERGRRAYRREVGEPAAKTPREPGRDKRGGAWSRGNENSAAFCDRPGCYQPRRPSERCPSRYCGQACAQAVRRVQDRERKWLRRKTFAGQLKRRLEYEIQRRRRGARTDDARGPAEFAPKSGRQAVLNYRELATEGVSCGDAQETPDDPEKAVDSRPRPPPS